ncbi:MAG: 30S ribosomal protein S17e [Candidatus Aenigmatarchaeota archaeon]
MGRIKTSLVKRIGLSLLEKYPEKFSQDFKKNKEVLKEVMEIKSKKIRNMVAGYITSYLKRKS